MDSYVTPLLKKFITKTRLARHFIRCLCGGTSGGKNENKKFNSKRLKDFSFFLFGLSPKRKK